MECRPFLERAARYARNTPGAQVLRRGAASAFVLLTAGFSLAGIAEADDLLTSNAGWSLYEVDSYELAVGDGERVAVEGACVAEAVSDGVRLDFITLIPNDNPDREPFYGSVILQVTSSNWAFRPRESNLSLVSGALTLTVAGSLYDFDKVNFNMGGYGNAPAALRVFVHMASEPIEIVDDAQVPVASFSSDGLLETFNEMLKCGMV